MSLLGKLARVSCGTKLGQVQWGQSLNTLGSKRSLALTQIVAKNYKYKPVPPKPNIPDQEELFGPPKGLNIPPGGYFLLIIPVGALFLGIWQVYRWRWKLELIAAMEQKVHAVPADFPINNLDELATMEYRKVKVRGTFDYSKEMLVGPRSLMFYGEESQAGGGLFTSQSRSARGFHIITPFVLEERNLTILVNRGWIPDRIPPKYKSTEGTVEIVGVVRKTEPRQPFMDKNYKPTLFLLIRDIPVIAESLGTEEIFLDLVSITGLDLSSARLHSLPVPGQTRVALRNEHVSYFCTWFSLSAITSFMWYKRFILRHTLR